MHKYLALAVISVPMMAQTPTASKPAPPAPPSAPATAVPAFSTAEMIALNDRLDKLNAAQKDIQQIVQQFEANHPGYRVNPQNFQITKAPEVKK